MCRADDLLALSPPKRSFVAAARCAARWRGMLGVSLAK